MTIFKETQRPTYGMWCYGCKAEVDVDVFNDDTDRAHKELENKAKALGWGMGLMASGQAYYSCADCAAGLFNFNVFHGHPLSPQESASE